MWTVWFVSVDVHHATIQVKFHLAARGVFARQGRTLLVNMLTCLVHDTHQLIAKLLFVHVAQLSELRHFDSCVELHVRFDGRQKLLLP